MTRCKCMLKYLGESVTVCTWGHHFHPLSWGPIRTFTPVFSSEWLPMLRWPGTCADFPAKSNYDIIGASSSDVPMMWGFFWMMTFTSQDTSGLGGIKWWMQGGRGSQFSDFSCKFWRCWAHRANLIASRVHWYAPTLGQPGMLHLLTTEICWVHWLLSISIFCDLALVFLDFGCLCDHQANRPSPRARVPSDNDCHPLLVPTEMEE